jgi:hypothetical protein
MPSSIDNFGPGLVLYDGENGEEAQTSSFPRLREDFESHSVPIRGVVLAVLISGFLWAAVILAGRALWLLLC